MTLWRFSSRTTRLDQSFLAEHLQGARAYRRIAGYFTSSLFEVAGEWLREIPEVRIVCNGDLSPEDLRVAKVREIRLLGRWHEQAVEADALLNRDRYRQLHAFLTARGPMIWVAPNTVCGFLHGKAGVIERADGRKVGFIGSMNETRQGWQTHYEILWEDDSPEGVAWIEAEFAHLWQAAKPLPEAVIQEVGRHARRVEIPLDDRVTPEEMAPAALAESPLYREGFSLQPWQQGFIAECLNHYRAYPAVRLLLADEVGLGKTLSLGTAAVALCLLAEQAGKGRKLVAIFAPATLIEQWQTEVMDKLGLPCGRWDSQGKIWLDPEARPVSPKGAAQIGRCPFRMGIISTGLLTQPTQEREFLGNLTFELLVLDEAHKARTRQGLGKNAGAPNELLKFMRAAAGRARHVLLGTATPIQTRPEDLWDLMGILHQGEGRFVLGEDLGPWHHPDRVLPVLTGQERVTDEEQGWALLRSPLPPVSSSAEGSLRRLLRDIRLELAMPDQRYEARVPVVNLPKDIREDLEDVLHEEREGTYFFQRHNPIVRHTVLRQRRTLEAKALLPRIGVNVHPERRLSRDPSAFSVLFADRALRTGEAFDRAYKGAEAFSRVLGQRGQGMGFMKNLLRQRVCSSCVAGLATAERMLAGRTEQETQDEQEGDLTMQTQAERNELQVLAAPLRALAEDPKLKAIRHYLTVEGWLNHGCIIFSQYYDTAAWVAGKLADLFPQERIGLYAGAGKSRLYHGGETVQMEREPLKRLVAEREVRLMVATDAACEGLNLQMLGTLINVDLPWNPTRLEQRLGRIKRLGQLRENVDMLNLVYQGTVDETIYERLSERMRDRYDLFGALPDTLKDEWIEDITRLGEEMDRYIEARRQATGFDLRYNATLEPGEDSWRNCAKVFARRDLVNLMGQGW
ncbi:Helicase-like protein [Nitrosococcus oceani ATCC 19707]|uniref:Helicase-like protein n=2 Tax=Nitrosococcus oceani TaxID=1229 RepID=Q3JDN1_NITOC|nr:phospholipase D-like domain-containing anti-phage protein [Nitrosococcus oceani]ABA57065.1 Helicase-like protein [Nitrosococcus oceani ATCC 19707]EDZ65650.1 Helicase conserved C-terminal domain protein [Nitrosococcus oceani AFC27]KFI20473.1 helicase [Nitrosococcus oceani C-27]GEM19921.1 helicase [Nitrosococcus oceani]